MKKYTFVLIALQAAMIVSAQNTNHNLFGLDMSQDWYSLTNYSKLGYFMAGEEDKTAPYIVTDFDFHLNKVDIEIENLGFTEHLLGFNRDVSLLDGLSPSIYIGKIKYNDNYAFTSQAFKDAESLRNKLIKDYGTPNLTIENPEARLYKWEVVGGMIIVNSVLQELTTSLVYQITSR
jgi:hypothetical protein